MPRTHRPALYVRSEKASDNYIKQVKAGTKSGSIALKAAHGLKPDPKTGDDSNLPIAMTVLGASAAMLAIALVYRRKTSK